MAFGQRAVATSTRLDCTGQSSSPFPSPVLAVGNAVNLFQG